MEGQYCESDRGADRLVPDMVYTAQDYWNLPDGRRAELIGGELWDLATPTRRHQRIVSRLGHLLNGFIDARGGTCEVYPAPFAVNLFADDSTIVEPDISVVCDASKLSDRGCEGAPDLVVEVVSKSTSGMDYISKLGLYHHAGVREYWIVDPLRERVFTYEFGPEVLLSEYSFEDNVASSVMKGFEVSFSQVVGA